MRRVHFILSLTILFAFPFSISSQQLMSPPQAATTTAPTTAAPTRDSQAIQLLSQAFRAIGGERAVGAQDFLIQGDMLSGDGQNTLVGTFASKSRGADFSMETIRDGHTVLYRVLNGQGSQSRDGKATPLPPFVTQGMTPDLLPFLSHWKAFGRSDSVVQMKGQAIIGGSACTLIHVEDSTVSQGRWPSTHGKVDVCIDPSTGLVIATRYSAPFGAFPNLLLSIENVFSQYKDFGGVILPSIITHSVNGHVAGIFHVRAAKLNNGFTDTEFKNLSTPR